jgi:hypothetical protein
MSRRIMSRTVPLLIGALSALAVLSPAAFASGPPIVNATTPYQESLNTATLGGTIDPNGAGTTYKVEYGRTQLYGQTSQTYSAEAGAVAALKVELIGLQQMSTYHYRISATNSFGTTTTPDALFENLLSWKVAGTRVESLASEAAYEDKFKGGATEGGKVELRGSQLKIATRIYCKQSAPSTGVLGSQYLNLEFNNGCFTQLNGVTNEACKPNGITLHLNGNLAQTAATVVKFSEACPIGESISFNQGGFALGIGTSEATEQAPDMHGTTYFGTKPWDIEYSVNVSKGTGAWKLSGANAGKAFGVS